jgi:hypothetical protein
VNATLRSDGRLALVTGGGSNPGPGRGRTLLVSAQGATVTVNGPGARTGGRVRGYPPLKRSRRESGMPGAAPYRPAPDLNVESVLGSIERISDRESARFLGDPDGVVPPALVPDPREPA